MPIIRLCPLKFWCFLVPHLFFFREKIRLRFRSLKNRSGKCVEWLIAQRRLARFCWNFVGWCNMCIRRPWDGTNLLSVKSKVVDVEIGLKLYRRLFDSLNGNGWNLVCWCAMNPRSCRIVGFALAGWLNWFYEMFETLLIFIVCNIVCIMLMFICCTLAVIQLLHVSPGSHKSFQSLATPVLFSVINVSCDAVFSNK